MVCFNVWFKVVCVRPDVTLCGWQYAKIQDLTGKEKKKGGKTRGGGGGGGGEEKETKITASVLKRDPNT